MTGGRGSRLGGSPLPRGTIDLRLLEALAQEGCPVCRAIEGMDQRYLFWFLHENLSKIGVPEDLARAPGFCSGHGEALLRHDAARLRIAVSHRVLVHRLHERRRRRTRRGFWRRARTGPDVIPGPCPACAARAEAGHRAAAAFSRLLERPPVTARYGGPAHLCLPHLRTVAPRLRRGALERVLLVHQAALEEACRSIGCCAVQPASGLLYLAAGHDLGPPVMPPPETGTPSPRLDLGQTLMRDIGDAQACPICLEMRRAWLAWLGDLNAEAANGRAPEDLLPTCPAHVWGALRAAKPELGRRITAHVLGVAADHAADALSALRDHAPEPRPVRRALRMVRRGPAGTAALRALARDASCPLCQRLAAARDAAVLLLFALLERPAERAAFENGYGLCIRHSMHALAHGPRAHVRACLEAVEAARLAVLERELAESARKSAWQARHEPKGAETTSPARALRRFSGFLCTPRADALEP